MVRTERRYLILQREELNRIRGSELLPILSGFRIRIHFLRIRIRIQRIRMEANTDPDTDTDPDPIRIQGFNDQKMKKNNS